MTGAECVCVCVCNLWKLWQGLTASPSWLFSWTTTHSNDVASQWTSTVRMQAVCKHNTQWHFPCCFTLETVSVWLPAAEQLRASMHACAADKYEWAADRLHALKWVRPCIFTWLTAHIHMHFRHILTQDFTNNSARRRERSPGKLEVGSKVFVQSCENTFACKHQASLLRKHVKHICKKNKNQTSKKTHASYI